MHAELKDSTGLLQLFERQSGNVIFGRNDYMEILWGAEEFLLQKEFVADGLKWLLCLDNLSYEYTSNTPKDSISKVLIPWYNFSAFQTGEEKVFAAEMTFRYDKNAWEYVYKVLPGFSIVNLTATIALMISTTISSINVAIRLLSDIHLRKSTAWYSVPLSILPCLCRRREKQQ